MLKTPSIAALLVAALAVPALAQLAPNELTPGIERGLETLNSSGQVGSVRIVRGASGPTILVDVKGSAGHPESVTIARGQDCNALDLASVLPLGKLHDGRLRAGSPLPADRLLSGNYNVIVHNNTPTSRPVMCAHLYRN